MSVKAGGVLNFAAVLPLCDCFRRMPCAWHRGCKMGVSDLCKQIIAKVMSVFRDIDFGEYGV